MRISWLRYAAPFALVLLVGLGASSRPPAPSPPQDAAPTLDPSKMPDIVGVRLGMTIGEAKGAFQKAYPVRIDVLQYPYGPEIV